MDCTHKNLAKALKSDSMEMRGFWCCTDCGALFDVQWPQDISAEYAVKLFISAFGSETEALSLAEKSDYTSDEAAKKRETCPHSVLESASDIQDLYRCPECGILVEVRIAYEITPIYAHTIMGLMFGEELYGKILELVAKEVQAEQAGEEAELGAAPAALELGEHETSEDPEVSGDLDDVDMDSSEDPLTWDGGVQV